MEVSAKSLGLATPAGAPTIDTSKAKRTISDNIRIDGQTLSRKTQITEIRVLKGLQVLSELSVTNPSPTYDISKETENLLNTIGCSFNLNRDADYTIISDQTDTELLNNPNIKDKAQGRSSDASAGTISTAKSFPSLNDPFLEPDSNITRASSIIKAAASMTKVSMNSTKLASDISLINRNSSYNSTSKYFTRPESTSTESVYSTTSNKTITIEPMLSSPSPSKTSSKSTK